MKIRRNIVEKEMKEESKGSSGQVIHESLMLVASSGQTSQLLESALLKPFRHSPPSDGQFKQKLHEPKPEDSGVRPCGKFLDSVEQAPMSMLKISVSGEICHALRSWFREEAPWNMFSIVMTEDVSKLDRSPLNEEAI